MFEIRTQRNIYFYPIIEKRLMKKIITSLTLAVAVAAIYSFTTVETPAKAKKMVTAPATVGTAIGDEAPEISMAGVDGKEIKLSSLRGKMVLIDFWASWCGPCRRENPNVVGAYDKYQKAKFKTAKGFDIFSVSLDQNGEAWKAAIEKDGLTWKSHVSDLKGWQNGAAADARLATRRRIVPRVAQSKRGHSRRSNARSRLHP